MSAASFLNGFAKGGRAAQDNALRDRELELYEQDLARGGSGRTLPGFAPDGYTPPDGGTGYTRRNGGGHTGGAGRPVQMNDPVADDLPPHARAMLNAIAVRESDGAYNVRYTPRGAATFEENGQHPRIFEKGPHGPSSAAGRYQHTATTWDDTGGGEFSRYNQDHRAWKLAQQRYKAATGRDLSAQLQEGGLNTSILSALAPTWAAFGVSGNRADILATYNDSYSRYSAPKPPAPKPKQLRVAPKAPLWDWSHKLSMGEPA